MLTGFTTNIGFYLCKKLNPLQYFSFPAIIVEHLIFLAPLLIIVTLYNLLG